MASREVEVKLVANVDEYVAAMERAAAATERFNAAAREADEHRKTVEED